MYNMFGKVDTQEMHRLANMLGGANIPYDICEAWGGLQITYPDDTDVVCSVIQHAFSYGGKEGYLEIMGLLTEEEGERDSVKGWLTAEDVFNRISMHYHAAQAATHATMAKAYADATIIGAGGEVWNGSAPSWD